MLFPTVDAAGRSVGPGWRNRPCVAGIGIVPAGGHPAWTGTYGSHLDRIVDSKEHMEGALSELCEVIGEDDKELAEREARELRRQRFRHLAGPRFALEHWMTALRRTRRGPCPPAPRLYERHFPASAAPSSEISAVLAQLGKAVSNREYFDTWRDLMVGQIRREALEVGAAERGVAVPGHEDYDTWRNVTDFAVGRCEGLNYGIHLDYIVRATEPRVGARAGARSAGRGRPAPRGDPGGATQG